MKASEKLNIFSKNLTALLKERNVGNWRLFSDPNYALYTECYNLAVKITEKELQEMEDADHVQCLLAAGWI